MQKAILNILEDSSTEKLRLEEMRKVVLNTLTISPERWLNAQTESLFGYARAELVGQVIETLLPSDSEDAIPSIVSISVQPRGPMGTGLDFFGLRKDGSELPVEILLLLIDRSKSAPL